MTKDNRPASQVLRELMRESVRRRREQREYDQFLRRKIEAARAQETAGLHYSNEEVEAEAVTRGAGMLCEARRREAEGPLDRGGPGGIA